MTEIIKLDLKDKKLLYELDKDSRQSNSEIGKKIRMNKNTVNYKIKKFEEEKLVLGYYAVIDNARLGYYSFRCYAKFFNTTAEQEKEIFDFLVKDPRVGVVCKIETVYDFSFMIWIKDSYEFEAFWYEFKHKFREYFWNERVDVFTSAYNFRRKYLIESKEQAEYDFIGTNKTVKHDDLDLEILRLLSKNARMPLIDIAEKLKTPERTIAFRIKQLEKNKIIQSYRTNLSYEKLGIEYFKVNIHLNKVPERKFLLEFANSHPNIIYYDITNNDYDYELDIEISNRKELLKLLEELKKHFQVRDIEILNFKEYYKLELMPQK
jgi:Lrp/AsnC family leucine-responsive transcriptional regulator